MMLYIVSKNAMTGVIYDKFNFSYSGRLKYKEILRCCLPNRRKDL